MARLGDQGQPVRRGQLGAGGELGGESAAHLGYSLAEVTLSGERPAFEDESMRAHEREAMCFREHERLVGEGASCRRVVSIPAHASGQVDTKSDTVGMR